MLAYKLRHKISIFKTASEKNSIGAVTKTNELVDSVYAHMQTAVGKTVANDDKILYSNEVTFIIRNYPDMKYTYFIEYNGDNYTIMGIQKLPDSTGQVIKAVRVNG